MFSPSSFILQIPTLTVQMLVSCMSIVYFEDVIAIVIVTVLFRFFCVLKVGALVCYSFYMLLMVLMTGVYH